MQVKSPLSRPAVRGRVALSLVSIGLLAGLVDLTSSAFSDTSAASGSAFQAGTLVLADDRPSGDALFTVRDAPDDATGSACLTVTNAGSVRYDRLTLARSAATGPLAGKVTIGVVALDTAVDTSGGSCAAFDRALAGGAHARTVAVGGSADGAASTEGELAYLAAPHSRVSYRVSYALALDDGDQGQAASGVGFTWSAAQGS